MSRSVPLSLRTLPKPVLCILLFSPPAPFILCGLHIRQPALRFFGLPRLWFMFPPLLKLRITSRSKSFALLTGRGKPRHLAFRYMALAASSASRTIIIACSSSSVLSCNFRKQSSATSSRLLANSLSSRCPISNVIDAPPLSTLTSNSSLNCEKLVRIVLMLMYPPVPYNNSFKPKPLRGAA